MTSANLLVPKYGEQSGYSGIYNSYNIICKISEVRSKKIHYQILFQKDIIHNVTQVLFNAKLVNFEIAQLFCLQNKVCSDSLVRYCFSKLQLEINRWLYCNNVYMSLWKFLMNKMPYIN